MTETYVGGANTRGDAAVHLRARLHRRRARRLRLRRPAPQGRDRRTGRRPGARRTRRRRRRRGRRDRRGVSYVGIALTPHDVAGAAHTQFVNFAFGFLLVFVLCLGFLEVRAGWPRRLVVANFVYAVLLAVYVYLLFWGPSTDYERGLVIQVVAQKVIVYGSILNLGWQALGFRRALRLEADPNDGPEPIPAPATPD